MWGFLPWPGVGPVTLLLSRQRGQAPGENLLRHCSTGATPYPVLRLDMSRAFSDSGLARAGIPSSCAGGPGLSAPAQGLCRVLGDGPSAGRQAFPRVPSPQGGQRQKESRSVLRQLIRLGVGSAAPGGVGSATVLDPPASMEGGSPSAFQNCKIWHRVEVSMVKTKDGI